MTDALGDLVHRRDDLVDRQDLTAHDLGVARRDDRDQAAARILEMGPELLVAKKGEDGAVVFSREGTFAVPGLPLDTIVDPTGAGDSFAGGFMGYLAATGDRSPEGIRRATIYGSTMGSLCCEAFSTEKLVDLEYHFQRWRFAHLKTVERIIGNKPGTGGSAGAPEAPLVSLLVALLLLPGAAWLCAALVALRLVGLSDYALGSVVVGAQTDE